VNDERSWQSRHKARRERRSTTTFALLNDANPTLVQKMVRHRYDAMTKVHLEEATGGADDAVMQM